MKKQYMYIGSWTEQYDEETDAKIIVLEYHSESDSWIMIQAIEVGYSVSWLRVDGKKKILYVCLETRNYLDEAAGGQIRWYHINERNGTLSDAGICNSYGAYPIAMEWSENYCFVLNHGSNLFKTCDVYRNDAGELETRFLYDTANLVLFSRNPDGNIGEARDFYRFEGAGQLPFFQETPSPHSLYKTGIDHTYFVPERGTDQMTCFQVDQSEMRISKKFSVLAPQESGPRNVVADESTTNCYLISEVEAKLIHYKQDGMGYQIAEEYPTVEKEILESCVVKKSSFEYPHPVDIVRSGSGQILYTLTRTSNTLGVFRLDDKGKIEEKKYFKLDGENPRQMVLVDEEMYIVFHQSAKVQKVILDKENGYPIMVLDVLEGIERIAVMDIYVAN